MRKHREKLVLRRSASASWKLASRSVLGPLALRDVAHHAYQHASSVNRGSAELTSTGRCGHLCAGGRSRKGSRAHRRWHLLLGQRQVLGAEDRGSRGTASLATIAVRAVAAALASKMRPSARRINSTMSRVWLPAAGSGGSLFGLLAFRDVTDNSHRPALSIRSVNRALRLRGKVLPSLRRQVTSATAWPALPASEQLCQPGSLVSR